MKGGIKNEEYGVLPYKLDSKGLAQYRIDPINDSSDKVKDLINSTTDIRALKDLHQIFKLISMKTKMPLQESVPFELSSFKESAQERYDELIREPLKL